MSYQATTAVFEHVPAERAAGSDRLVLLALANHASGDTMECWPSIALIAREAGVSQDTVRRSLRALERAGLIERFVNGAPDARIPADRRPNLYRLHLTAPADTGGRETATRDTGGRETRQRGGESRVHGGDDHASTGGRDCPPKQSGNHQGTVNEQSREIERVTKAEFQEFWNAYPRKTGGPKAAEAKYRAARKAGTSHETIMAGVAGYVADLRRRSPERQFIAHATTWLNQGRWEDDYSDVELRRGTVTGEGVRLAFDSLSIAGKDGSDG